MVEDTKLCLGPLCKGVCKPLSDFYARSSSRDGCQAWCKDCSRHRRSVWAVENRELLRLHYGAAHRRRMTDPDRAAAERARKRDWQRRARGTKTENHRTSVYMRGGMDQELLPGAPFVAWLKWVLERDDTSINELAALWDISDKTLREIRKGRRQASIETVERALIADGSVRFDELYPDATLEAA